MKRYKLLKDLPFAKAGAIFKGELEYGTTVLFPEDYENYKHKLSSDEFYDFDEWFEEYKEYFTIETTSLFVVRVKKEPMIKNLKSLGLLFETEEKTKKHREYLKAKAIINWVLSYVVKEADIYFKSQADILDSFDKHPKEWETYLAYEQ